MYPLPHMHPHHSHNWCSLPQPITAKFRPIPALPMQRKTNPQTAHIDKQAYYSFIEPGRMKG